MNPINITSLSCAVNAGIAAAQLSPYITVGSSGENKALEQAVCSGIISQGGNVISLGRCIKPVAALASELSDTPLCLYIKDETTPKIKAFSKGGLPLESDKEAAFLKAMNSPVQKNKEGVVTDGTIFHILYKRSLENLIPKNCPYTINLSTSGYHPCISLPENGEEVVIQLSPDGTKASLYSDKSGFVSYEQLVLFCCMDELEKCRDISLPFDFAFSADAFADSYGCKAYRYFTVGGKNDEVARKIASKQKFTLDGLYLALNALNIAVRKKISLKDIEELVPQFHTLQKFVCAQCDEINEILKSTLGDITPDGTSFTRRNGRVLLRPSSSGKGLWINIESHSMETAQEIFGKIEDKIRHKKM